MTERPRINPYRAQPGAKVADKLAHDKRAARSDPRSAVGCGDSTQRMVLTDRDLWIAIRSLELRSGVGRAKDLEAAAATVVAIAASEADSADFDILREHLRRVGP